MVKRTVNRPHGSVMAIVAAERAGMVGDSKGHQQVALAVLENVSYGQLQAVSTEAPIVEPEKYVITPPPIMEGRGVVKRFGSRVHVLPMHSGSVFLFLLYLYALIFCLVSIPSLIRAK